MNKHEFADMSDSTFDTLQVQTFKINPFPLHDCCNVHPQKVHCPQFVIISTYNENNS